MSLLRGQRGGMARGGLARGGLVVSGSSLDPDAAAYIAAVETAKGSAVTATQRNAIDVFIAGEKAAARWGSIKRLYLPIWGVAAANAICMRSLASGTFTVSGVTHTNGYIQSNGTTGYFTPSGNMAADGLTTSSGMMFLARKSVPGVSGFSLGNTSPGRVLILPQLTLNRMRSDWGDASNTHTSASQADNTDGIFITNRTATGIRHSFRDASGRVAETQTRSASGSVLSGPARVMSGVSGLSDTSHFLSFGWGLELSDANDAAFSLAIKTLWEICTGLTLP